MQVFIPVDVTRMMVGDQNLPTRRPKTLLPDNPPAALQPNQRACASPDVSAGVNRVGQKAPETSPRQPPTDLAVRIARLTSRKFDALLAHPQNDLAGAAEFAELGEYQADRLPHTRIGIDFQAVAGGEHVADRYQAVELAAARLLLSRLQRALPDRSEFHLAEGALHAQEQTVIGQARIVDAVLVDDQRPHNDAEVQQRMPVASITRQPRGLD